MTRPRWTIGRLMIAVAVAAVGSMVCRVAGPGPGGLICGWLAAGWLAWAIGRSHPRAARAWAYLEGSGVALAALGFGMMINLPGAAVVGAGALLLVLAPVHLGSGLGWLASARAANRAAIDPQSTGPIWGFLLAPVAVIVAGLMVLARFITGR